MIVEGEGITPQQAWHSTSEEFKASPSPVLIRRLSDITAFQEHAEREGIQNRDLEFPTMADFDAVLNEFSIQRVGIDTMEKGTGSEAMTRPMVRSILEKRFKGSLEGVNPVH